MAHRSSSARMVAAISALYTVCRVDGPRWSGENLGRGGVGCVENGRRADPAVDIGPIGIDVVGVDVSSERVSVGEGA